MADRYKNDTKWEEAMRAAYPDKEFVSAVSEVSDDGTYCEEQREEPSDSKELLSVCTAEKALYGYNPVYYPDLCRPAYSVEEMQERERKQFENDEELRKYRDKKIIDTQAEAYKQAVKDANSLMKKEREEEIRTNAKVSEAALTTEVFKNDTGFLGVRRTRINMPELDTCLVNYIPESWILSPAEGPIENVLFVRWWTLAGDFKEMYLRESEWDGAGLKRKLIAVGIKVNASKGIKEIYDKMLAFLINQADHKDVPIRYGWTTLSNGELTRTFRKKGNQIWKDVITACR